MAESRPWRTVPAKADFRSRRSVAAVVAPTSRRSDAED